MKSCKLLYFQFNVQGKWKRELNESLNSLQQMVSENKRAKEIDVSLRHATVDGEVERIGESHDDVDDVNLWDGKINVKQVDEDVPH